MKSKNMVAAVIVAAITITTIVMAHMFAEKGTVTAMLIVDAYFAVPVFIMFDIYNWIKRR